MMHLTSQAWFRNRWHVWRVERDGSKHWIASFSTEAAAASHAHWLNTFCVIELVNYTPQSARCPACSQEAT